MKLGCAVHTLSNRPPYDDAIQEISALDFTGFELIAFSPEEMKDYYGVNNRRALKTLYKGEGLELSEFILYAPLVEGLLSRNKGERQDAYDTFARGIEIAKSLDTDIINIVSNWPAEMSAPIDYLPSFIHPSARGVTAFDPKLKMNLPVNFDANGVWETYMQSLEHLVKMAEQARIRFALEGHANVVVSTTDAFMRMFDRIHSPSFGTNFDACWQFVQREYLPWSVYKLRSHILHMHVRDGDGMSCYALPPGMGVIDWRGLVRALKEVGYEGYLSFEIGGYANPLPYLKAGRLYLENILCEENAFAR